MRYPTTVDLYLGGDWVDATPDLYARDDVLIARGKQRAASSAQPASASLTLNDRSGNYSPDNPLGAYFGDIGQNTPIRIAKTLTTDAFNRIVSNGWGSTDTGLAWTVLGTPSRFAVSSGAATISFSAASVFDAIYLGGLQQADVEIETAVSMSAGVPTGAGIYITNALFRGVGTNNYFMASCLIATTGAIQLQLWKLVSGVFTQLEGTATTGLTYTPGMIIRVKAQTEGRIIRIKAWDDSTPEPFNWRHDTGADQFLTAGWVGLRSDIPAGNTNTKPIVITYHDVTVRSLRFHGEVANWQTRMDASGEDRYSVVTAADVTRRLGQGASSLSSTMYRALTTLATPPVGYWPCEDGQDASSIASGLPGGLAASFSGGIQLAAYSGFAASLPVPTLKAGTQDGWAAIACPVSVYTATGFVQLRYLMHAPASPEIANLSIISGLICSGSAGVWDIKYRTTGDLSVECHDVVFGNLLLDSGSLDFNIIDKDIVLSLELTQNGANIDWSIKTMEVGASSSQVISGTLNSRDFGVATYVLIDPYFQCDGMAVGHINVRKEVTNLFDDLSKPLKANAGEFADARFGRLCDEQGIFWLTAGVDATPAMGPQLPKAFLDLLDECESADQGILYASRGGVYLVLHEVSTLYAQAPKLTLDRLASQITDPGGPTRDDLGIRNDVTASRPDGGSRRYEQTEGRLSVATPQDGGVGRYDEQVTVNVATDDQLQDIASWRVALGTVDEPRYPKVTTELASPHADVITSAALDVDIGDRIVLTNLRTSISADDVSLLVVGYAERDGDTLHTLAFNCEPESPYHVGVVETTDVRPDSDDSTLTGGPYGPGVSPLSVAVASESLWTTNPADFPFDVLISGERVTVAGISGSSSPQTFTVTRGVNDIDKTLPNGAQVRLFDPTIVGL